MILKKSGHILHEPKSGILTANEKVHFKISAANATKMSVSVEGNKKWVSLQRVGENFEGDVVVNKGEVTVLAAYPESKKGDQCYVLKYRAI